jgi:Ca-activated chloride channel family protein
MVSPRRFRRCRSAALAVLLLAAALPAPAAAASEKELVAALPEVYQEWLAEVEPLITKEERATFLKLEKDYQRDAFIERFWQVRDPFPDTARNELRENWSTRVAEAKQLFGSLEEDRSRFYLLNGPPALRMSDTCGVLLWPTEVWIYPATERVPEVLVLVFYQRFGQGRFRLWYPADGLASLLQAPYPGATPDQMLQEILNRCLRQENFAAAIAAVARKGQFDYSIVVGRAEKKIEAPSREWVASFNSYSTDLPEAAEPLPGILAVQYPGKRQSRTVVQGTIGIPVDKVGVAELGGARSYNLVLNGEIILGRKLFDSFRYKFDFPASSVASAEIPMVFERFLRPGSYRMIVKVEDLNGKRFFRTEQTLTVPALEGEMGPPPPPDEESARLFAEANAALSTLENTIQLVEPRGEMKSGLVRFDTLTTGAEIDEVQFMLDGKALLRKSRPPFSVELDLGQIPRTRTLQAIALSADGTEVASDELLINASTHRFSINLVEPRKGKAYKQSLRAESLVEVPEGGTVERVEYYLNETRVATLYQEPWTQPIALPAGDEIAYVRAVAYQPDGNSTEDLVFVNAPENLEELDVQFVELYTSVLDRQGRPVGDLGRESFTVSEDGVRQEVVRFEQVETLPVHVAVLLDVSASMETSLGDARAAALQFFETAITPKDRAALIPFNDRPALSVKLTNRVEDLAGGLAGLKAERGTSLYDAVVFSLFYFNGVKGQRAILLLSDGKDENSRFTFEQTLDFARRAGVAIYSIGLDIGRTEFETRKILKRIAEETGGREFYVKSAAELAPIYEAIQKELRARYLLAYQSSNVSQDQKFRTVQVDVDGSGLEAKTMRGYYP